MTNCEGRAFKRSRSASGCKFLLSGPFPAIKVDLTASARHGSSVADELADCMIVDQWLSGPVDTDRAKETVLNRIPFGCSGRVVGYRDAQAGPVCELLKPGLPSMRSRTVGTARIGQDQEFTSGRVHDASSEAPPLIDGIGCEGRRVMRRADDDKSVAAGHIIDSIRNGDALCIARKVVDPNVQRRLTPSTARVLEQSDQLPLLGVHADDRLPAPRERFLLPVDLQELPIPVWGRLPRQSLPVEPKTILLYAEHPPSFGVAHPKSTRHIAGRFARPLHRRHRIPCGRTFQYVI